jgi:hypothetical protein
MSGVFLGFVTGSDFMAKMFGLGGLGVAILIVRMVIAPEVVTLLGDRTWVAAEVAGPCAAEPLARAPRGNG